jgi:adenylate cyclase
VLEGRFPKNEFSDKIVLVGASALGLSDMKVTPTSVSMPGVEKHGHVVASLIEGKILEKAPDVLDIFLLLLIGLLLTLVLPRVKAIAGTIFSIITLTAFAAAGYFLFLNKGVMINMAYPLTEIFLVYIGITAYNFASEESRAKKIKMMFSSYVTERVVDELIKNPEMAKLGGERKEVTILFSDIRGFTSFSESRPPEEVVTQLNEYLGAMTEVVFKHEGTLDKFIGDAIMAFWGAPLDQNNHVELAIRCALHMVDRLSDLQKKWKSEGKEPFSIGIGLNTGEVLVGNIGIEGKKIDYTVIGDHVNLASRVESLTRTYNADILLTEYTYSMIKDLTDSQKSDKVIKSAIGHSKFSKIDTVKVKGKEQSVVIYRLESHPHRA